MINEQLVSKWIHTAKDIDESAHMPSKEHLILSLRVVLEELFESAEACGADMLSEFADVVIEAAKVQKEKVQSGAPLNEWMVALRDAIADTFVTACNLPVYAGLIAFSENDFNEVMRSNFTKFCETEQDAKLSIEKYAKEWREVIAKKKGDYFVILDAKTGKILKGVHYEDPKII